MYVYVYSLIFILTLWHSCWRTSTATLTGTCLHSCVGTCTQRKARVTCGMSLQASVRGEYFAENIEGKKGFWAGISRKMRAKYPPWPLSLHSDTCVWARVSESGPRPRCRSLSWPHTRTRNAFPLAKNTLLYCYNENKLIEAQMKSWLSELTYQESTSI